MACLTTARLSVDAPAQCVMAAVAPPLKKSPSAAGAPSALKAKEKSLDEKLAEAAGKLRDRIDGPIWGRFEEVRSGILCANATDLSVLTSHV
jgi:hypothetical protein